MHIMRDHFQMFISIRLLNNPGAADIQFEVCSIDCIFHRNNKFPQVSPLDKIQDIKARIFEQINIPINQQKLVFKGKPLHDGSLQDHQITDGTKLHLIIVPQQSTIVPMNNVLINELRLLASKWIENPNDREAFVTAFQIVNQRNFDNH